MNTNAPRGPLAGPSARVYLAAMRCDRLWRNARLATLVDSDASGAGLGIIENGTIAVRDGHIVYVGNESAVRAGLAADQIIDCEGRLVTPGLVDCHTHLVYAGNRAAEFEQRLAGVSYEEIARRGGGIVATVNATRAATLEQLIAESLPRATALAAEGVTTVEIKSGYGLSLEHERKQLRAARALGAVQTRGIDVRTTFLGAHAVPPEFAGRADDYLESVCEMLTVLAAEGLIDAVDAFCENIGFTREQTRRVFAAAKASNLPVKLHAEQLSNMHGAALAAEYGALSADHLEHADEAGIEAMAKAGTVAVLLPGAFYFLRETRMPPVERLRAHGVPIALATDCNPGTSPLTSPLLVMNMAATIFRMTIDECLIGLTRTGARALGLSDRGTLEVGKRCDLAIWDVETPAELVYHIGRNPLHARVWRGK
jgi:imidazolonepropionase